MARPPSRHPTDLELQILKIIWRGGPMSVRQVREALALERELAHTSVMTVMNIMVEKKYLRRKRARVGFIYHPRVAEEPTLRAMLRSMLDRVFDGSTSALMLNLLDAAPMDAEELARLRALIDQKARERSP